MSSQLQYDIIIVGAGIVGLTAALAFSRLGQLNIAVLDQREIKLAPAKQNASRVSAITAASKNIFSHLQVWPQLKCLSAFKQIQIWDAAFQTCQFQARDHDAQVLGFIAENDEIYAALLATVKTKSNIYLHPSVRLETYHQDTNGVLLNNHFFGKLICAADGADSWVRSQNQMTLQQEDYAQSAIIANVATDITHAQTAQQYFLKQGPLAFLPLQHPLHRSIVWSAPTGEIEKLMQLSDADFCAALLTETQSAGSFKKIKLLSPRQMHTLKMRHADQYVMDHVVLLGDAAHTLHPLAGLGLNMGLLDVAYLYDCVFANIKKHRRYEKRYNLRSFERIARVKNAEKIQMIASIKKIFASQTKPLPFWRHLGLSMLNEQTLLKRLCIGFATGEDLPSLAQTSQGLAC